VGATILAGIAGLLTASGGAVLVVREFRRRDHRSANREIKMLSDDLDTCRSEELRWRGYAHRLRQRLADEGVETPDPPPR
jgi:hypothetical protein